MEVPKLQVYEPIHCSIRLGLRELTPECAYLLGAILSADESFSSEETRYWLVPVRHNSGQINQEEMEEHRLFLQQIIGRSGGRIFEKSELVARHWFPANKLGFAGVFQSEAEVTAQQVLEEIEAGVFHSPNDIIRCFIVGAFDGRCSVDRDPASNKIRNLVIDCENESVARFLSRLLEKLHILHNYNPARDRLYGGRPRKEQLRVQGSENVSLFMQSIGIISPFKFRQLQQSFSALPFVHLQNSLLPGLKTLGIQEQSEPTFLIPTGSQQQMELALDQALANDLSLSFLMGKQGFVYAGTPKPKQQPTIIQGQKTYRRNRQVAANALMLADYRCEIDSGHVSFVRRNTVLPYMEPHHLIPLAFYEMFPVSLDVEENIICLCSNCHNQLHYGQDIHPLLQALFLQRKDLLEQAGIFITLPELYKMYSY